MRLYRYQCLITLLITAALFHVIKCQQLVINRITDKTAACDDNFLYFHLVFEQPFTGLIYTDGEYGNLRCTYVNGLTFSSTHYNISIPLTDCRTQRFSNGTRQNAVIVQKDQRILESTDNLFVLSCAPAYANFAGGYGPNQRFTLSFLGINVANSFASTEFVTSQNNNLINPATATFDYSVEVQQGRGPNGPLVQKVLTVGEPISYVVKLRNLRSGTDARLGRCWATDGTSDIQLSDDDGCSLQPNNNIWNTFQTSPDNQDNRLFYNNIKTWAFPTSNKVNIFCNLHICPSACSIATCRLGLGLTKSASLLKSSLIRRRDIANETAAEVLQIAGGYRVLTSANAITSDDESYLAFRKENASSLSANFLLVTAPGDSLEWSSAAAAAAVDGGSEKICISRTIFIISVILLMFIITLTFGFVIFVLIYMYRVSRQRAVQRRTLPQGYSNITLCGSDCVHK